MAANRDNLQIVTIDLILDRRSTTEVLSAVLHAILFHRLFGTVKPTTFEIQDITVPGVDDAEMAQLVDEKVNAFWKAIEVSPVKRGQIVVTFSERRARRGWFSIGGEEEVPWEQWTINAEIRQPTSSQPNIAAMLTKALHIILTQASSDAGRSAIPPITSNSGISPFPVKVVVRANGVEVG